MLNKSSIIIEMELRLEHKVSVKSLYYKMIIKNLGFKDGAMFLGRWN